jgi:hypothetical protein
VLSSEAFASGRYATDLVERLPRAAGEEAVPDAAWIAAALAGQRAAPGEPDGGGSPRVAGDPWSDASGWRLAP